MFCSKWALFSNPITYGCWATTGTILLVSWGAMARLATWAENYVYRHTLVGAIMRDYVRQRKSSRNHTLHVWWHEPFTQALVYTLCTLEGRGVLVLKLWRANWGGTSLSWRDHARLCEKTWFITKSHTSCAITRTFHPGTCIYTVYTWGEGGGMLVLKLWRANWGGMSLSGVPCCTVVLSTFAPITFPQVQILCI